MSYILDALRRADAERERGAVPGLHSQPVPVAETAAPRTHARTWPWVAAGVAALLLVGAFAWTLVRREAAEAVAVAPPAPAPAPSARAARSPDAPAPMPAAPPAAETVPPPATAARAAAEEPIVAIAAPRLAPAAEPAPASAAASAAAPAAPTPWGRVPEDLRRQFPPLVFGGAIWSAQAANRMLVVGGQLMHEGDTLAPGVVLEQIGPKSAIVRWRGQRYEFGF